MRQIRHFTDRANRARAIKVTETTRQNSWYLHVRRRAVMRFSVIEPTSCLETTPTENAPYLLIRYATQRELYLIIVRYVKHVSNVL